MEEHKELAGSPSESLDKDNVPLSSFIARRKKEKRKKKKRSRSGDDEDLVVSPSKKGAHGANDVRDGSVVVVNDGGDSCEQESGLVKSGEDGEFSENKLVGAGMGGKRSRMDVFEYNEDDLFDYKRIKKECGDRDGSDVGRSDALGSKSLKTSGKLDESETGRESDVVVEKGEFSKKIRNDSSFVDPDADFAKNDRLTMDEDASFHPVSSPREKLGSPCEKSIRVQGKNGVLKLMISNKKQDGGPERSYGYDEPEENRTGYTSAGNSNESTRYLRNRRSIVLMEKSKLNLQAFSLTQKSRVQDWRPEDSDTSILLGSTDMENCDSEKGHRIERDSTLTSEICLPAKHMGAEVSRGVGTEKQLLREQIRKMLVKAGWEIDFRPRTGKNYNDAVYTDPTGREHWSILNAYHALQRQSEDEEAEGNYGGAYAAFSPLPEEVLSMLTRRTRKKIERENRMKKKSSRGSSKAKEAAQRKSGKNRFFTVSKSGNTNRGNLNFLIKNKCKSLKVRNKTTSFVSLSTKGSGKVQKSAFVAKKVGCNSTGAPDKVTGKLTRVLKPSLASSALLPQARKSKKPNGCTLLVRSSKKGAYPDGNGFTPYAGKRTILSWMIDSGTVPLSGKVQYMNKRRTRTLLEGWVTRDGIHCSCCSKILTVSKFEIHAGSKLRQPFQNIYVEAGISLLQCQINTWNKQEESERIGFSSIDCNGDDPNDDTCGICGDGGDLICCDGCPSTFHQSCVDIKILPTGDWHCSNCSCKFCGLSGDDGVGDVAAVSKLFTCSSCGGKYHQQCTEQTTADIASFCGRNCEELFKQLQKLLWVKHELEAGFSWTLIQRCDLDSDISPQWLSWKAECNSKLAVALKVMDECFFPIIDRRSGLNLIHNVLYNFGSNFNRLNYSGFYTAILERGDEIISAASIRIHGNKLAEMPFIGTRHIYRRQGMCRRLLNAIELALCSLKVEKLIIPAISELMHTWTMAFGFRALDESHKQIMRSLNLLVFPGTAMLQKVLLEGNGNDGSARELTKLDRNQPITCEVKEKSPYSSLRPDRSASDERASLRENETNDNGFVLKADLGNPDCSNVEKWMRSMLSMEFFGPCTYHPKIKKNEFKFFCIECVLPICCHCIHDHAGHQYIQIRRYVHRDVIKLKDMQQFFDCSSICAYYTNGEKVLFINPRPLASHARRQPGSRDCGSCGRTLQDSSLYCSIACKVSVLDNLRDSEPVSTRCRDSSSVLQTTTNGSNMIHNSDMDIHDTLQLESKENEVSCAVPNGTCPGKSNELSSNEGLSDDRCEVKTEGAGVQELHVSGVSCLPSSSDSGTRDQDATVEQVLEVSSKSIRCPSQEGSSQPLDTFSKGCSLGSSESLQRRDSKLIDKIDGCALDKRETSAGVCGVKNEFGPAELNPETLSKGTGDCSSEGDDESDKRTSGELLSYCGKSSFVVSLLPASGVDEHSKPSVTDDSCVDNRNDANAHLSSQTAVLDIHMVAEFSSVNPNCQPSVNNTLDTASESHFQGISEITNFGNPSHQESRESDENEIPALKDDVATFQSNVLDDNSKEDVATFESNSVGETFVHETSEDIAKSLNKVT